MVTVVVPTLNEASCLPDLLGDLATVPEVREVVVVDGGSTDATCTLAANAGARVLAAPGGRGPQLRAGAAAAHGEWLCFLHADVRVPPQARQDLARAVADPRCQAAVWRLAIDAEGWWFRVLEHGAAWRARIGGLAYGDQGLLVRRAVYEEAGGYPALPILEDVALIRTLRRRVAVRRLPSAVTVSARRWRREGSVRAWVRNAAVLSAFLAGVSAERLARWYRPESPGSGRTPVP